MIVRVLILIFLFGFGATYKLLVVFPFPGKSHAILGEGLVKHLLNAGHEITYISQIPMRDPSPHIRQIVINSDEEMYVNKNLIMNFPSGRVGLSIIHNLLYDVVNASVMSEGVQTFLLDVDQQFDAVIAEWMFNEVLAGFSAVFNCPLIWSSSMIPHSSILWLIDEALHPAYTAGNMESRDIPPLSFWGRMDELWLLMWSRYYEWKMSALNEKVYTSAFQSAVEKRGRKLPSFYEIKYNGSLVLGNSHVSTGDGNPMPLNYVHIGGYHIDTPVKPLPQDLKEIMDNATNGVIYFSMGSLLMSTVLPSTFKQSFIDMFSTLNHTVLWKLDEDLSLPENVHNVKWAPQQSILAHPNCMLFISHGGLLSATETLHLGVPIIGLPIYGDQENNINRAVAKGYGIKVTIGYDSALKVKEAIDEIFNNPRYRIKAKEVSWIYHHRPVPPGQELVYWVEHVVRTGGAPHLRSIRLRVPWYQKMFLDLAALLLGIFVILYGLIRYALSHRRDSRYKLKFN
ncbi:UDP-glycosyltransferase UGT5-like [Epargyreus clarus]|uniref:UDP-glycosyltransferase UGT5-like n=1 Tax=Epargyreus clarus TaxID=520877 RepID=UPI003C3046AA